MSFNAKIFSILGAISLGLILLMMPAYEKKSSVDSDNKFKLYWFIPDGFRADPEVFNIYKWAMAGELPNIKWMMENGSYGYSMPVFPGHTPTNFATLLTGASPLVHGVADGPMRTEKYPLKMVAKGGFSSTAKKVPPIWHYLEQTGELVTLISVPGSTPPEIHKGITIKGRWGGWGADFPSTIFQSSKEWNESSPLANRVFYFGPELTKKTPYSRPKDWAFQLPDSHSPPFEAKLEHWGLTLFAYFTDSTDDGIENFDRVTLSRDKTQLLTQVETTKWSDWQAIDLKYQTKNDYNINTPKKMKWEQKLSEITIASHLKIKVIKLGGYGFFRIRFIYEGLNEHLIHPSYMYQDILDETGPMVDFVDNYPPQLIHYREDKTTFLEEAELSTQWHKRMASFATQKVSNDIVVHDIYTPNQLLTSRWWLGYLDPTSHRYKDVSEKERTQLWREAKQVYKNIDEILGEAIKNRSKDSYIVLSSDHGAIPLNTEVMLNNLFAREGLLKFKEENGILSVDWKNTNAVFLKMNSIYINPKGLDGAYKRTTGPAYEALRLRVIKLLTELKNENGDTPVQKILKWEDAKNWSMPHDRTGDLILANKPGYGWSEELRADMQIFSIAQVAGYKQAILPKGVNGMLTPFMIAGPGIRKRHQLNKSIQHIDQYPTILKALGKPIPAHVEGVVLNDVFSPSDSKGETR